MRLLKAIIGTAVLSLFAWFIVAAKSQPRDDGKVLVNNSRWINAPKFEIVVWLDGEPQAGENSVAAGWFAASTQNDLAALVRMIGLRYATDKNRTVRISVYNLAVEGWCKPDGTAINEFAAYALELQIQCAGGRY